MQYANDKYFLQCLQREVDRARRKHPTNFDLFSALVEEIGEVARALQDNDIDNLIDELIQVACVAMRLTTEGDLQHKPCREAARRFAERHIEEIASYDK